MPDTATRARKPRLEGRVAIVTGGSSGIGRATCLALAREGASVVVVGRNRGRLDAVVQRIGELHRAEAVALALDVRSEPDMSRMAEETLRRFGQIDVFVASAGILRPPGTTLTPVARTPLPVWDEVIETNVRGVFLGIRAVLPHMLERGRGEIVNLSSRAGLRGVALDAPYCASKFAVIGLTESLAEETRGRGVRVQLVAPGNFETPVWSQNGPLARPADLAPPERVADLIVEMVTLPADTRIVSPVTETLRVPERPAWLGAGSSATR